MNLSSDLEIFKILNIFKDKCYKDIEQVLYYKYKFELNKLNDVIKYLNNSNIKDNDITIQILLNKFLEFKSTLKENEIKVLDNENDLVLLKLVKLQLEILNKIKSNELEHISELAKEIEIIKYKELITTKELELAFNIEERNQKKLRINNEIPYVQKKDEFGLPKKGAKIYYNVKDIRKWIDEQKH